MRDDVYLKLYDWLVKIGMGQEMILPEDTFREDLGFDSIDMTETIMWAEEEFDIHISEAGLVDANVKTVAQFANHIIDCQLKMLNRGVAKPGRTQLVLIQSFQGFKSPRPFQISCHRSLDW